MWLKGSLFLVIGALCLGLVWTQVPEVHTAVLLVVGTWAFCRAYYFAFYVLEKYADPQFRYAGLVSLVRYIFRSSRGRT